MTIRSSFKTPTERSQFIKDRMMRLLDTLNKSVMYVAPDKIAGEDSLATNTKEETS